MRDKGASTKDKVHNVHRLHVDYGRGIDEKVNSTRSAKYAVQSMKTTYYLLLTTYYLLLTTYNILRTAYYVLRTGGRT